MRFTIRGLGITLVLFIGNAALSQSFQWLSDLSNNETLRSVSDMTPDGKYVIGTRSFSTGNTEAYIWSQEDGIVGLGDLTGGQSASQGFGVSNDGSVVVGNAVIAGPSPGTELDTGFRWRRTGGIQIKAVKSISANGRIVAGDGRRGPEGTLEAWIATVPDPPKSDFNDDNLLDCADVDPLVSAIAAGTNDVAFDLTSDGLVNSADLVEWLRVAGRVNNFVTALPILPGDTNLDGVVDGSDFGIWNAHKFTSIAA